MKKVLALAAVIVLAFTLVGCSGQESPSEPPNLIGNWKQANSNSPDSYQEASVTEDTITVNWVSDGGGTKSIYWVGTYVAPTEATDSYTWDSANDTEQTSKAMLASGEETKTFTYSGGVLSYEVSALGTTTEVKLERI